MRTGFVIPVYNHGVTLEQVLQPLLPFGLPIIVVDDGNDAANRAYIHAAAGKYGQVVLVTREKNGGKGAAMNSGARKAWELGLTHVFQLDADGQHDTSACADFLEASRQRPDALICGYPRYDGSVPAARRKGREFSNNWARLVSFGGDIRDILCGFRIYPLEPFMKVLDGCAYMDQRMGYDVEIVVRLLWKGVPIVNKEVRVTYPADGVSNFRLVRDNAAISLTFARLCCGMLLRLPVLLARAARRGRRR